MTRRTTRRTLAFRLVGVGFAVVAAAVAALAAAGPGQASETRTIIGSSLVNDGALALGRGKIGKAIDLTRRALDSGDLKPHDIAVAHSNLCAAFEALRAFQIALDHCTRAIDINGRNWRFYNNRGTARLGLGDVAGALVDYEKAKSLNPYHPIIDRNLAIALGRLETGDTAPMVPERDT